MKLKTALLISFVLAGSPATAAGPTARFEVPASVSPEAAKALAKTELGRLLLELADGLHA